jgi:hypothetical protein
VSPNQKKGLPSRKINRLFSLTLNYPFVLAENENKTQKMIRIRNIIEDFFKTRDKR